MSELSDHFGSEKLRCPDGCGYGERPGDVDVKLLIVLEGMRRARGADLPVEFCCRCDAWELDDCPEAMPSHRRGMAAHVPFLDEVDCWKIVWAAREAGAIGIWIHPHFVHVDVDRLPQRPKLGWGRPSEAK